MIIYLISTVGISDSRRKSFKPSLPNVNNMLPLLYNNETVVQEGALAEKKSTRMQCKDNTLEANKTWCT